MKLRDSGMPDEAYWESLFNIPLILSALGIDSKLRDVTELGCGYGTFAIPIARAIGGTIYAFDIEPAMVALTASRSKHLGLKNVVCRTRDVMEEGFGLIPGSVDAAFLFNILHCEHPQTLLQHAVEAVASSGWIFVIHWRLDPKTPRGPSLAIRPKPEQIVQWAEHTGQLTQDGGTIDLQPWHFGLRFRRQ